MSFFKNFVSGMWFGMKASWKHARGVQICYLIINVWLIIAFAKGPHTFKAFLVKLLIANVLAIPVAIYYIISGKYIKVLEASLSNS
jgi:hypothetical protein